MHKASILTTAETNLWRIILQRDASHQEELFGSWIEDNLAGKRQAKGVGDFNLFGGRETEVADVEVPVGGMPAAASAGKEADFSGSKTCLHIHVSPCCPGTLIQDVIGRHRKISEGQPAIDFESVVFRREPLYSGKEVICQTQGELPEIV